MGIDALAEAISAMLPDIVALVPAEPAARLGRWEPKGYSPQGTAVQSGLEEAGGLLAERLLGALELTVDRLTVDIPAELVSGLTSPTVTRFGMVSVGEESATRQAVAIVEQVHPGATDLVVRLAGALQNIAAVPAATGSEAEIAAQHGASHFALAVLVATAVLRSLGTAVGAATPAIVGTALGTATILLPTVPKPAAYVDAVLAKRRAEYVIPRSSSMSAPVRDHMFCITEGSVPANVDFSANGLVAAVDDGLAVRTGMSEGHVRTSVFILASPPDEIDLTNWDDVVEISWTAPEGGARLLHDAEPRHYGGRRQWETPPWPGEYRVRVHASGRDDGDDSFHLLMWQAPLADAVVHKKTDRLGHRLRGEPEPPVVVPPDAAHRWITKSSLNEAATITVVRGLTPAEVISTLGGDPSSPVSIKSIAEQPVWERHNQPNYGYLRLITVLEVDGFVLAVEENGFQGADHETVAALSRNGKAASLYWNVNANYRLTFASEGELLFSGDPRHDEGAPESPDLDFEDFRHRIPVGLTAVARFVGRGVTEEDLATIYENDEAYVVED